MGIARSNWFVTVNSTRRIYFKDSDNKESLTSIECISEGSKDISPMLIMTDVQLLTPRFFNDLDVGVIWRNVNNAPDRAIPYSRTGHSLRRLKKLEFRKVLSRQVRPDAGLGRSEPPVRARGPRRNSSAPCLHMRVSRLLKSITRYARYCRGQGESGIGFVFNLLLSALSNFPAVSFGVELICLLPTYHL